jgi:hypothetical protein
MATAKQIAWRKKFGKMAKSGAFRKGGAKKSRVTSSRKRNTAKQPAAKRPATKRPATRKKNPVSCIRNGKRIYGAAAAAVLKKRKNSTKRKTTAPNSRRRSAPVARRKNSLRSVRPYTRKRRNSAATTSEAYEQFQGRATASTVEVMIPDDAPRDVYVLGMLAEIKTREEDIKFEPGEAYLVADKDDNLYVGATRAANSVFEPNEFLGELQSISYVTVKDHLDGEEIEYVHKLGEEGGEKPTLATNDKGQLEILGGDYFITADGIRD